MSLHVLHFTQSLKPEAGSVAISLQGLFGALQRCGVASKAVTLDGIGGGCENEIEVASFKAAAVQSLIQDADVVHLHGFGTDLARLAAGTARKMGKPYVISPLGTLTEGPYRKRSWRDKLRSWLVENKLIRQAAAITAVTQRERDDLQAGSAAKDVTLLPYGLGISEYEHANGAAGDSTDLPDGRCLLLLGPIHPIEGCVPLLKAFAELGNDADGWKVVLAGPGKEDWRNMLEAAVRRKQASDRVVFASAQDIATQRSWLARASVVVGASLHTRCPVSIMQAVAAGVPVIASKFVTPPGLEEVVHVCSPNRAELREALRRLFGLSDEERETLAQKAREVGRSVFDWSVLVDRYVQFYRGLV